jgi:hypothetical protein
MMKTSLLDREKLFGLFELDPIGTVLYSRIEPDGASSGGEPSVAGHNFFDEVIPFENVDEFRQRITLFTHGDVQVGNFNFVCRLNDESLPVRVLLARIRERSNGEHTKSILVHIRKAQSFAP